MPAVNFVKSQFCQKWGIWGNFGRTSSSCSSQKEKIFAICFLGLCLAIENVYMQPF